MPDLNSTLQSYIPKGKQSLKPKKHHGFALVLIVAGFLFPPLAVAVRFGIGTDFFINLFLCILGYFPCHFHNFYVQNIRNNSNKRRTPKWAIRYGLVDPEEMNRKKAKSAWAGRYEERNAHSTLEGAEYAEDQVADVLANPTDTSAAGRAARREERLWNDDEVEYYGNGEGAVPGTEAPNKKHWHYPANFEGAGAGPPLHEDHTPGDRNPSSSRYNFDDDAGKKNKKKSDKKAKKNAMSTYNDEDVPEWGRDYGAPRGGGLRSSDSSRSVSSSVNAGGATGGGNGSSRTKARDDGDGLNHTF